MSFSVFSKFPSSRRLARLPRVLAASPCQPGPASPRCAPSHRAFSAVSRQSPFSPRAQLNRTGASLQRYSTATLPTGLEVEITAPNGQTWLQPQGLFINNEYVKSSTGDTVVTINPTTEEEICAVYAASAKDVDTAVKAARKAFRDPSWKKLSGTERGKLLYKLADLAEKNAEILATIETLDNGKPYKTSLNDSVTEFVDTLRYYAGWADKVQGNVIDVGPNKMAFTVHEPLGVCGQIIPWNFPLEMAAWKLGPALACGNTIVLKLAEQTPLSMLYMTKLIKEAGFPPGVINVINGYGREAGAALSQHEDVDKIAFTGSTATGREIMKMAASNLKNVTLETGGKSPLLVFSDADLDLAATWAHSGIMYNQGQICTATSRILVHSSVHDRFVELFKAAVSEVSIVGDPFHEDTFQGPQVTRAQYENVLRFVQVGQDEGATLVMGGRPKGGPLAHDGHTNKGFFVEPTVFTDVTPNMTIFREEIFGPCVAIAKFETEEEALEMANDSTYGLGAAVFTRNLTRAHRVSREIVAGMVWINSSNDIDFRVPFGGVKQSGIGRELGEAGLAVYSTSKSIHINMEAS